MKRTSSSSKTAAPAAKRAKVAGKSGEASDGSAGHTGTKEDIVRILTELGDVEKARGERFKERAYRKAAKLVSSHAGAITSGAEASKLPGIGVKIAKKIDEILASGRLGSLERAQDDPKLSAIRLISSVQGIGPIKARQLVEQDVTTLEQLEKRTDLTHYARVGLRYHADLAQRIPRADVEEIEREVAAVAAAHDPDLKLIVCGSYRRGAASSGDVDFLITHPSYTKAAAESSSPPPLLAKLVKALTSAGLWIDSFSAGAKKVMGVVRLPGKPARHVDLRIIPREEYWFGVLYFTGSDQFNVDLRVAATKLGFTLNEYSLRPKGATGELGDPLPAESEADIFELLDMEYVEPSQR